MTKKQLQKENNELLNEIDIYKERAEYWRQKAGQYAAIVTQYAQSRQKIWNLIKQAEHAVQQEYIEMARAKEGDANATTEKTEHNGT